MYQQLFFIGQKFLGTASRGPVHIHGDLQAPQSYAYFCPVCGEVWARAPVRLGESVKQYQVWSRACKQHHIEGGGVSGSLLLPWDREFNKCLPDDAWFWEADRHMDWMEARNANQL